MSLPGQSVGVGQFEMFPGFLVLAAALTSTAASPLERTSKSTCRSCPPTISEEGFINVHLIPHSHDDVGWLKTMDQYFHGTLNSIYYASVNEIIQSVVDELPKNPIRRFILVETAFLKMWWDLKDEAGRSKLRSLVENGQIEIISGAWSMHDEAVTHYQSIIDQFTWGMKTIDDMFDSSECAKPRVGWQIDAFGHSRETASLLAQMGFDGLFFARLDKDDRARRIKNKEMEFVWEASANIGNSSQLFTSVFYKHYSAPEGFCFDLHHCFDHSIFENPKSSRFNVKERVREFLTHLHIQQRAYPHTQHMLVPMGDDFTYQYAPAWFDNIDLLIKHVNAEQKKGSKFNLLYSTPSCYLQAVHSANVTWTKKSDDFFPYADGDHSYWTGYYTSRPTQKFMERKGNNFLQTVKQLSVLADLRDEKLDNLTSLREVMGVMQHHDAITGTEKQHVADDYARMLHEGFINSQITAEEALNKLVKKPTVEAPAVEFKSCLLSNISQCDVSENSDMFVVTLYNPTAQEASSYVRLPVQNYKYQVFDDGMEVTPTQMLKIPTAVVNYPIYNNNAEQELVFKATIPPLGFKSYHVTKTHTHSPIPKPLFGASKFKLKSSLLELTFDRFTGMVSSLYLTSLKRKYVELKQNFFYYEAKSKTKTQAREQKSGAYIFRPDGSPVQITSMAEIETFKGPLVEEIHQKFSEWVTQVIRVYLDSEFVEFEWMIGGIPMDEEPECIGKEIITRYQISPFQSNKTFYTDSNGREIIKRQLNYRPTWRANIKEPVAGNYYPVTTMISTRDESTEFGVLVDRAQGGTSLQDGVLELMLHRRLPQDDGRGVAEPMNETQYGKGLVARGRHLMYLAHLSESPTPVAKQRRWSRDYMVLYPWAFYTSTNLSANEWRENYITHFTGLRQPVPENINILTLEPWNNGTDVLVRYEHFFESDDDPSLSAQTQAPILDLLQRFGPKNEMQEMTLGGNKLLAKSSRLKFRAGHDLNEGFNASQLVCGSDQHTCPLQQNILLRPMEIRTFIVKAAVETEHPPVMILIVAAAVFLCAKLMMI